MLSLAAARVKSVQSTRLINTSCFSRRSSPLRPRMHRSIRSLMRMRSIAVFMQVAPSINIDNVACNEIALNQEGNGIRDVLCFSVALERDSMNEALKKALVFAGRRQDQTRSDCIDADIRREFQRHHARHCCEYMLAPDIADVCPVIALQAGIVQI